ncbi:peptidase C14 [Methyloglobulus sp.]|uniref:peptidase C14 n=1 Tax=Methyloglobulus sp. TaxID=2518622 RepID=UPI0039897D94
MPLLKSTFANGTFTEKVCYFFLAASITAFSGCQTISDSELRRSKEAEGYNPQDTDKLFIVDCLLPGQIHKLGSQMTFLTARRPIKTAAGDCELRGGEYVAYDRANYATALKAWLAQAQQGDVEAQVTVGEIYEKGLGGAPEPGLAAEWYLKAAEQGNSRAMVNLSYLYEKGRGVKADKATAQNWLKRASGLDKSGLPFATVTNELAPNNYYSQLAGYKEETENLRAELDKTKQQLEETNAQSNVVTAQAATTDNTELNRERRKSKELEAKLNTLSAELDETKQQHSKQQQTLQNKQEELNNLQNKLNQEQGKSTRNENLIQSLQQELTTKLTNLENNKQQVTALENTLQQKKRLYSAAQSDVLAASTGTTDNGELVREREKSKGYETELRRLRAQLDTASQQLSEQKHKYQSIKKQLNTARNERLVQTLQKDEADSQSSLNMQELQVIHLETQIKNKKRQILAKSDTASNEKNEGSGLVASEHKIEELQAQLKSTQDEYDSMFAQIKKEMGIIDEKTQQAVTNQDKLAVENLRSKLTIEKSDLATQGKKIKSLKNALAQEQSILASLQDTEIYKIAQAGPVIEIIDPPLKLTRGSQSYRLRTIAKTKDIIGKVVPVSALKSLEINDHTLQVDKEGIFKSSVALEDTTTTVKIVAVDVNNKSSVLNFNLLVPKQAVTQTPNQSLEKIISVSYPNVDFGSFYALIIGNDDYSNLQDLKSSVNDAKAVGQVLRTRYGYKTKLLLNATRHQVMSAFNELRKTLIENDNLLIYYAGHGDLDKGDQSAYWLPSDAEAGNPANWLSSNDITQYVSVISAKHILVIADSCYSGALTKSTIVRLPDDMPEEKREKWLNFMTKRKARTVMTSGGVEPVLDSGSGNHSVFANAFLSALKINKGVMEDYELYRMIASKVKKSASLAGFEQLPQYSAMQHAGHEGSPFFFVPRS